MLTQQQLDERLNYVTGSYAAVICGLIPYKTKAQLWLEKTGRAVQEDISEKNYIKFGNYMEAGTANWFQNDSGKSLIFSESDMLVHKDYDWMAGNYDFKLENENAILECKTAGRPGEEWGDGENIIPPHYLMQVAHYCAVGNFDKAYIGVVFALTREFRWYEYERNIKLEEQLIALEKDFWFNNVLADVAPEPTTEKDILCLYKETNSNPVIANQTTDELVIKMIKLSAEIKAKELEYKAVKDSIAVYMKDADTLIDSAGNVMATWKYTKPISRFDKESLEKDYPDVYKKYLTTTAPQRRFNIKRG
jgi:putative phage-type endonuclease